MEETEEEALSRKTELFNTVLMSITADSLALPIKLASQGMRATNNAVFSGIDLDLASTVIAEESDSGTYEIIEKPPQVSKMSYCMSEKRRVK